MAPDESSPAKLKREARRTALREAALAKEREKREKEEESERARERKGQKRAKPPAPRREKRFSAQKALRTLRAWANHHNIRLPPEYKRIRQWVYATARGIDYARSPTSLLRDLLQWKRDVQKLFDHPELPKMVVLRRPSIVPQARLMSRIYRGFLEMFRETIREGSFDAVLIPEDVVGYVWPVAVKAAHDAQIPALVFPYTLANRNEPLQSLRNEPGFQTKNNEAAARLYPAWRAKENGADLIRLPSPHVFAHEWLHIAPPNPWMMNSGYADAICVDSPSSFAYFAAGGIRAGSDDGGRRLGEPGCDVRAQARQGHALVRAAAQSWGWRGTSRSSCSADARTSSWARSQAASSPTSTPSRRSSAKAWRRSPPTTISWSGRIRIFPTSGRCSIASGSRPQRRRPRGSCRSRACSWRSRRRRSAGRLPARSRPSTTTCSTTDTSILETRQASCRCPRRIDSSRPSARSVPAPNAMRSSRRGSRPTASAGA